MTFWKMISEFGGEMKADCHREKRWQKWSLIKKAQQLFL